MAQDVDSRVHAQLLECLRAIGATADGTSLVVRAAIEHVQLRVRVPSRAIRRLVPRAPSSKAKRKRVRIAWIRLHVLVHFVPGGQLSVACNVAALPRAGAGNGWGGAGEGRPGRAGRLRAAASRGVAAGAQSRVGVDRRHANGRPFVDAAPPC